MADNCAKIDICLVSIVFSQLRLQLHTQEQLIDLSIIHCPNTLSLQQRKVNSLSLSIIQISIKTIFTFVQSNKAFFSLVHAITPLEENKSFLEKVNSISVVKMFPFSSPAYIYICIPHFHFPPIREAAGNHQSGEIV